MIRGGGKPEASDLDHNTRQTGEKTPIAILISGRGSNMRALVEAARASDYPAEIVCVISNRLEAAGLAWAKEQGIPARALDHSRYLDRDEFEAHLHNVLTGAKVELVVCAGFMRLFNPAFVERWRDRILNIHPSLLPAFRGLHTHQRAITAGVKITGCTVHLVRPEMDDGPIIAQAAVPVLDGDTAAILEARVLAAEHRLYPHALRHFLLTRRADGAAVPTPGIDLAHPLFSPPLPKSR